MICKINVKSFFSADFQALILVRNKLRILGRRCYHIQSFSEERNKNDLKLANKASNLNPTFICKEAILLDVAEFHFLPQLQCFLFLCNKKSFHFHCAV